MFKLNLKIALRNLFKNKVYAAINISGLAIGLTAFVFVLLYINHEESYDRWSPALKSVYQVRERHSFFSPDNQEHWQETNNSRVAALIKESLPQVKAVTKVDQLWEFNDGASIKTEHADPVIVKNIRDADSTFFHVFPYHFLQGDEQTALQKPNSVVLKESTALKLFGNVKVLGKQIRILRWERDKGTPLTITGVVADPLSPESVMFNAITRTGYRDKDPENPASVTYCQIYASLNGKIDTAVLNHSLTTAYLAFQDKQMGRSARKIKDKTTENKSGLKLVALENVHAEPTLAISWAEKLKPILAISIFLLLVSVINFINLATAQSVQRAKEVGVKKVLGSYKKQLIAQFLTESALQSITSLFLTIILIEILLPAFNHQFNVDLSFWHNPQLFFIILQLLGLFVLVTLLAGLYPAWILANYNPVSVLKGNYENGLKGIAFRNALVVFQFVISVTFIISIGVMGMQMRYMNNKDLGFDKSKLINIKTSYNENFADKLKRIPGVQYVATTTQVMGNTFNFDNPITYKGNTIPVNSVTVTMETLPALGVKVLAGRIFSPAYKADTVNTAVLNEAAAKLIGKQVIGEQITQDQQTATLQIVGVIQDYHSEGFDKTVLPTIYKVTQQGGSSSTNNLLVRFNTENYNDAIKKIEHEWKALYPDFPMQYTAVQDSFGQMLEENNRFMNMIVLFSLVSISLSLFGLFALSTFLAKRRTKEIAIRKIMGASNLQLINMLNRSFLILVVIANLISWPIAYILTGKWLAGFAYRIDMPVLPFVLATLISIIIAVITVSIQARKAAVNNPVDALKYE